MDEPKLLTIYVLFPDKTHIDLPLNSVGSPVFVPRRGETIDAKGMDWKVVDVAWDVEELVCTVIVE